MKKCFVVIFMILFAMASPVYANDEVIIEIPEFNVSVNGHVIDIMHSQYPVIKYKGITYFPMTADYLSGIGLDLTYSTAEGLSISKSDSIGAFEEQFLGAYNQLGAKRTAYIANYDIKVNDKYINNMEEEYPILMFKNITYFPMTWRFAVDEFGWQTQWSDTDGFGIVVSKPASGTVSRSYTREIKTATEIGELSDAVVKLVIQTSDGKLKYGSGFFTDDKGTLVTNYHVLEKVKSLEIVVNDGTVYDYAKVKDFRAGHDLAVLETNIKNTSFIRFTEEDPKMGNTIYTIGSPHGLTNTLSVGIVSAIREDAIQISAPISPGSSGGVLLNEYGEALGVTSSGILEGENLGFAIPIDRLEPLTENIGLTIVDFGKFTKNFEKNIHSNGIYYGSYNNNKCDGYGEYYWIGGDYDGDSYAGVFEDGYKHGYGTYVAKDRYIYRGDHIEDSRTGTGSYEFSTGESYIGDVVNGAYEGYGAYTHSDGSRYIGDWIDNDKHGFGTMFFVSGDKYAGDWVKDYRTGHGTLTFTDGDVYVGEFLNGYFHGYGTYTFSTGVVWEGQWLNDEFQDLN